MPRNRQARTRGPTSLLLRHNCSGCQSQRRGQATLPLAARVRLRAGGGLAREARDPQLGLLREAKHHSVGLRRGLRENPAGLAPNPLLLLDLRVIGTRDDSLRRPERSVSQRQRGRRVRTGEPLRRRVPCPLRAELHRAGLKARGGSGTSLPNRGPRLRSAASAQVLLAQKVAGVKSLAGIASRRGPRPLLDGVAAPSRRVLTTAHRLTCTGLLLQSGPRAAAKEAGTGDRKSTRLNSSHGYISYAVFCL